MDGAMIGWLVAMGVFWILILYGALMDPGGGDDSEDLREHDAALQGDLRRLRPLDEGTGRGARRHPQPDEEERMEGDNEREPLL